MKFPVTANIGRRPFFQIIREFKHQRTATPTKTSLETTKQLGKIVIFFVIIGSSSHPSFLIEHAANGLVEVPLK